MIRQITVVTLDGCPPLTVDYELSGGRREPVWAVIRSAWCEEYGPAVLDRDLLAMIEADIVEAWASGELR